jgi:AcrR family transcriptional regulator
MNTFILEVLKMTRLRKNKRKKIEEKIIKAARNLFQSQGYENVSMEEISAKADIAVGTLYNYFKNKSDLYLVAMESQFSKKVDIDKFDKIKGNTASELIYNFLQKYLNGFMKPLGLLISKKIIRDIFIAVIGLYKKQGNKFNKLIESDFKFMSKIEDFLKYLKDKNILGDVNTKDLSENIFSIVMYEMLSYAFSEEITFDQMNKNISRKISGILGE